METADTPPQLESQGWKRRDLPGFIGLAGPLWTRRQDEGWSYGVLCEASHLNPAGVVHGGLVTTLLDHAISSVGWEAAGRAACVTLQLDTHFARPVRAGQFAQARAELAHRTRGLLFMRGEVRVEGELIASGQAILKVLAPAQGR